MKIKMFTHIDLDGLGCAVIAKFAYGRNATIDVEFCEYNNINERVNAFLSSPNCYDYDIMFITDISVNDKKVLNKINEYDITNEAVLLDHHATSLYLNKFDWAMVAVKDSSGKPTCGTELLYRWLKMTHLLFFSRPADDFVRYVTGWDTFLWRTDEKAYSLSDSLNLLLKKYDKLSFVDKMSYRLACLYNESFTLDSEDSAFVESKKFERETYIKDAMSVAYKTKSSDDMNIGILFSTVKEFDSMLGNTYCEANPDIDYCLIINIATGYTSLRTCKDNIHVGNVAKQHGGGGHDKAAGYIVRYNIEDILDLGFRP